MSDKKLSEKEIKALKFKKMIFLHLCISQYALSALLLIYTASYFDAAEWKHGALFGLLGCYNCHRGDKNRNKYLDIRDLLKQQKQK